MCSFLLHRFAANEIGIIFKKFIFQSIIIQRYLIVKFFFPDFESSDKWLSEQIIHFLFSIIFFFHIDKMYILNQNRFLLHCPL